MFEISEPYFRLGAVIGIIIIAAINTYVYTAWAYYRREHRLVTQWKKEREEHEQRMLRLQEFLKLTTSVAATVAIWNTEVRFGFRLCLVPDVLMTVSVDQDAEDGPRLLVQCGAGDEMPQALVLATVGLNGTVSLKRGRSCFRQPQVHTAQEAAEHIRRIVDDYLFLYVHETAS